MALLLVVVQAVTPWHQSLVLSRPKRNKCLRLLATRAGDDETAENEKDGVRVEVSNSVMRMLQGSSVEVGGLIQRNEHKRTKKAREDMILRDELFAKCGMYVPRHDNLFPLFVATFGAVTDDDDDDGRAATERFSSDVGKMKAIVEEDVLRMKSSSFLASQLFCDLNGQPLNAKGDFRFERWFLLSMYVKFRLWWKGPSPAADLALEYAYRMSNYIFDPRGELGRIMSKLQGFSLARRLAIRYGRLFVGRLNAGESSSAFLARVQGELDKEERGWAALIMPSSESVDEVACLVTHCTSLVFFQLPEDKATWISYFLLLWAAATALQVGQVSTSFPLMEHSIVSLGFTGILGGSTLVRRAVGWLYGISRLLCPLFVIPVPLVGAIPTFSYNAGCLPTRACLFDISAASSMGCIALSLLVIAGSSYTSSGVSVTVEPDIFSHSGALSWLLNEVSVDQGAGVGLALSPMTLAGLMGLNFGIFSLLPVMASDGGRMLAASFGRRLSRSISTLTLVSVIATLLSRNFVLGFLWACSCAAMPEDSFQRDEVSDPGPVRKAVAMIVTFAAAAALVPVINN